MTRAQERFYESRRVRWLDDLWKDVHYALRALFRNPSFTTIAILTLALGIGANTAIFSVVHALLLKPLPYKDSDRLVRLVLNVPAAESPTGGPLRMAGGINPAELIELRSRTKVLSRAGIYGPAFMTLTSHGEAVRLEGMRVSSAIFQMLSAQPLLGRVFNAEEETPSADPVIVLSYSTWHRHFASDPNILGQTLTLEDNLMLLLGNKEYSKKYTVVGVMPETFGFPNDQTQFWVPAVGARARRWCFSGAARRWSLNPHRLKSTLFCARYGRVQEERSMSLPVNKTNWSRL